MPDSFELKVLQLHWIKGEKQEEANRDDLCAHGSLYVRIGEQILSDASTGPWTLSATALYLMRTVFQDHKVGDFFNHLLPCCGHFFIASDDGNSVVITGCPTGVDWNIEHLSNHTIKHSTPKGAEGYIHLEDYKKLVVAFAEAVELLYQESLPKNTPTDEFAKEGYKAFWKEWKALKSALTNG